MKSSKLLMFILGFVMVFTLAGCNNSSDNSTVVSIDGHEWHLQVANELNIKNEANTLIARDDTWVTEDTDAPVVDVILVAKNGKLTITDKDSEKTYSGAYKEMESTQDGTIFEITIGSLSGHGTVSVTKYLDGTEIPTFAISIVDGDTQYALQFQGK